VAWRKDRFKKTSSEDTLLLCWLGGRGVYTLLGWHKQLLRKTIFILKPTEKKLIDKFSLSVIGYQYRITDKYFKCLAAACNIIVLWYVICKFIGTKKMSGESYDVASDLRCSLSNTSIEPNIKKLSKENFCQH